MGKAHGPVRPVFDVSVVTAGHDVADARLHREVAALLAAGLSVEVLGLGRTEDGPPGAAVRTRPRRRMLARAGAAALLPWRARGAVLLAPDPDVILAAVAAQSLRRRRVVADVHEDYAALLCDRPWARGVVGVLAGLLVRLATAAAARAALTLVADAHVPPLVARRRLVVRNLPVPAHLPAPSPPDERPRALYVGDVRRSRGLFAMLDALELAPDWTLDVVGPVAAADRAELDARLDGAVGDRVRLHGRLPPAQAWMLAPGAWAGLALLEDTPAFRAAVPSKLYEYLACGLPVVVTDLPRQRALLQAQTETAGDVVSTAKAGREAGQVLTRWSRDGASYARARQGAAAAAGQGLVDGGAYAELAATVAWLCTTRRPI